MKILVVGKRMEFLGVSAVELNLSCPHTKSYGLDIGCDPKLVSKITSSLKENIGIPVFVKLSPNVNNIVEIAKAAKDGNADALVAINTVKAMKIDLELGIPILSNKIGGYSGKAIKPIGIRCVYEIAKNVDTPIIGVGGITTGEDALEYIMAGASAVQIGTGVHYRGLDVFRNVCDELEQLMKDHGYKNIKEITGVAHT